MGEGGVREGRKPNGSCALRIQAERGTERAQRDSLSIGVTFGRKPFLPKASKVTKEVSHRKPYGMRQATHICAP